MAIVWSQVGTMVPSTMEHGVPGEALAWLEREHRSELVDHAIRRRILRPQQRSEFALASTGLTNEQITTQLVLSPLHSGGNHSHPPAPPA